MIRTYTPSQIADAILAGDLVRETEFVLAFEVERLRAFEAAHKQLQAALDIAIRERDEARAEVAKQISHGDLLYDQIEHRTSERDEARAELDRLREEVVALRRLSDRRERIATAALQGMLANPNDWKLGTRDRVAVTATRYADALIAELDKEQQP